MLESVEKAFDEIAIAVEEWTEGRDALWVRHWLDAGACAAFAKSGAHSVAVVSSVSKQDAASPRPWSISSADRPSRACLSISLRAMGRPSASAHATGSAIFWHWQRAGGRGSTRIRSSGCRLHKLLKRPAISVPSAPPCASGRSGSRSRVRPVTCRYIRPGRARAKPPEYPVQHAAVINPRNPANLGWQQWLNHRPLKIRQIETRHHQPPRIG